LRYPTNIPGVDSKILNPKNTWASAEEYEQTLNRVADLFRKNFNKFERDASAQVKSGGPQ
jgi:phosphoenolpyruvate carboxykinase (ATP)